MWVIRCRKPTTFGLLAVPLVLVIVVTIITFIHIQTTREIDENIGTIPYVKENFITCPAGRTICENCTSERDYLLSKMDVRANPCVDFYQYACGKHKLPSTLDQLQGKFIKTLESKLKLEPNNTLETNIQNFYTACRNASPEKNIQINEVEKVLENFIKMDKSPAFFKLKKPTFPFNWLKAAAQCKRFLDLKVFFSVDVEPNRENQKYLLTFRKKIGSSRLKRSPSITQNKFIGELGMYKFIEKVTQKKVDHKTIRNAVLRINGVHSHLEMLINYYHEFGSLVCLTLGQFDSVFESKVKFRIRHLKLKNVWFDFIRHLYVDVSKTMEFHFKKSDQVCYEPGTMDYLVGLYVWIVGLKTVYLELYVWYAISYEMLRYTTDFERVSSRDTLCAIMVADYMQLPIESLFFYTKNTSEMDIPRAVTDAFLDKVKSAPWADSAVVNRIINTFKRRDTHIGYPSEKISLLKMYFRNLHIETGDPVLINIIKVIQTSVMITLHHYVWEYKRPWMMTMNIPFDIHFNPVFNILFVHGAFLEEPVYFGEEELATRPLNFALLGFLIARAALLDFSLKEIGYDEYGNEVDTRIWLGSQAFENLLDAKLCFKARFKSYRDCNNKAVKLKDLSVLIADSTGLRFAYRAYKKLVKTEGCPPSFPGLKLTDDELFFVAFASYFCENPCKKSDNIPLKVRLMNTLQNSKDFAAAFKCKTYQPMTPWRKHCGMW